MEIGDVVEIVRPGNSWVGDFPVEMFIDRHPDVYNMIHPSTHWEQMVGSTGKIIDIHKKFYHLVVIIDSRSTQFKASHMVLGPEGIKALPKLFFDQELFNLE